MAAQWGKAGDFCFIFVLMTPIEELDYMLKFFALNAYARMFLNDAEIDTYCNNLQNVEDRLNAERKIPHERLRNILGKLEDDKYIERIMNNPAAELRGIMLPEQT